MLQARSTQRAICSAFLLARRNQSAPGSTRGELPADILSSGCRVLGSPNLLCVEGWEISSLALGQVRCEDGVLQGASLSDKGFVIISMFFDAETEQHTELPAAVGEAAQPGKLSVQREPVPGLVQPSLISL